MQHTEKESAGNLIKKIRRYKHITQKEVARKSGLSHQAISQIERGEYETKINNLIRIASALEVPLYELLPSTWREIQQKMELLKSEGIDIDDSEFLYNLSDKLPGVSYPVIEALVQNYKDRMHSSQRASRIAAIKGLYAQGHSAEEISRKLKISIAEAEKGINAKVSGGVALSTVPLDEDTAKKLTTSALVEYLNSFEELEVYPTSIAGSKEERYDFLVGEHLTASMNRREFLRFSDKLEKIIRIELNDLFSGSDE